MARKSSIVFLVMVVLISSLASARDVNVLLKNRNVVVGRLVEEHTDHIMVISDIGQVRIARDAIESITYDPFVRFEDSAAGDSRMGERADDNPRDRATLNDRVVVHLRNGSAVSGLLLAKSLSMVMVQTDAGRLTIPKGDVRLMEYVSSEYAERGELVIVRLANGTSFQGSIYYEDGATLTVETDLGRLTIDKKKLRSIEYTGTPAILGAPFTVDAPAGRPAVPLPEDRPRIPGRFMESRLDDFEAGYSSRFGSNYSPGFLLGYTGRFLLAQFDGFYFNANAHLGLALFSLDNEAFAVGTSPAAATVRGGAFITTIGLGPSINLQPQAAGFYEFYLSPSAEGHIIHKKLDRTFPSFPALDSKLQETKFFFGVGNKIGLDFFFDDWRGGISYNNHFIFGDDDYNRFSIHFVKRIF